MVRIFKLLALIAVVGIGGLVQVHSAMAEPFTYAINGGVNGRQYWFYSGNVNPIYNTLARDAIGGDWDLISSSRIYYAETTDYNSSEADWYALHYGNTSWAGVTAFRIAGGIGVSNCLGCPPYQAWDYAEISLNDDKLADTVLFPTSAKVKAVESHEFGHAVGLGHEGDNVSHPCQLMNEFLLDDWRTGCSPSTTQTWDKVWARQLQ